MAQLGIIGTGLIGASIGLAAKRRGWTVDGYDPDPTAASAARQAGAIDRVADREELYARCDVVVIAAHLNATLEEIASLRSRSLREGVLVMDIGSVKAPIVRAAEGIEAFVPTHPMAGSERSGADAARADLFDERTWCYVPTRNAKLTGRARTFIEMLGAQAVAVDAEQHDRIVALTSHLPQLLAYVFRDLIEESTEKEGDVVAALCGPTARELLRLGRSSHAMWDDIFALNSAAVDTEVARLRRVLDDRRLSG